ncbi:hypothetical protein [Leisingera sp. ANG-M6]|uniref:hypothetical protein n=1 Tax=Leisingera sp. ANG-M6 TaxID=1577900 RepID=UPI00057E21DF|nr:hypothetical protein [Leisingera sp. ANG-M6]KIC30054.1 hypothetical protein RA24_03680 [Leisingera sp. ANG-M6]
MTGMIVGVDEVTLEYSVDDGTTWGEVLEAKNVVIPEEQPEWRKRTTLSVTDRRHRYGRGMVDVAENAITCFYTTEAYKAAKAMEARPDTSPVLFRVTFPVNTETQSTGDVFQWGALVQVGGGGEQDVESDLEFKINMRTQGGVTFTEGAAI